MGTDTKAIKDWLQQHQISEVECLVPDVTGNARDVLDFWDAALWLFASIFIELNVFAWQQETTRAAAAEVTGSSHVQFR